MKTLAEIYAAIPHWKDGYKYCDKGDVHSYVEVYEQLLAPHRRPGVRFLEIGLFHGASLRMFEEYFAVPPMPLPRGSSFPAAVGIDCSDRPHDGMADLRPMIATGGHDIRLLNAADPQEVYARFINDPSFDVIIEDAGHAVADQLAIYANFRNRVAPGGLYIIEDIENIDRDRVIFENIDSTRRVEIIDRRQVKGRFDDVLVVIHG